MTIDMLDTQLVAPEGAKRYLLPLYVALLEGEGAAAKTSCLLGEMHGVRWVPDALASPESMVDDFIVFPDVNRVLWHSFMALGDE